MRKLTVIVLFVALTVTPLAAISYQDYQAVVLIGTVVKVERLMPVDGGITQDDIFIPVHRTDVDILVSYPFTSEVVTVRFHGVAAEALRGERVAPALVLGEKVSVRAYLNQVDVEGIRLLELRALSIRRAILD